MLHIHRVLDTEGTLERKVEEWWLTESFGTKYEQETPRSREDRKALDILEKTVKRVGDRYEAGLLCKEQDVKFPDNRATAEKYRAIIEDYEEKGYAKKLSFAEASIPTPKQWFLPHRPVLNPNKPGKVRMVMDAAAKHEGVSLNDKLHVGPDLLNNLVGVLLRFREHRVGVAADIEAMFHQCRVAKKDLRQFELPRCMCKDARPDALVQLHIFANASEKGFDAVCYARYVLPGGRIHVAFVMAKSRVAPLKQLRSAQERAPTSDRLPSCVCSKKIHPTIREG